MSNIIVDSLFDGDFDDALHRLKELEEYMPFRTPRSDAFLDTNWFVSLYLGQSPQLELMFMDTAPAAGEWRHGTLWLYREHRFADPYVLVFIYHDHDGRYGAAVIPHYEEDDDRRHALEQMYAKLGSHARVMETLQAARDELDGTFARQRRELGMGLRPI